jgi:hypothetical protein
MKRLLPSLTGMVIVASTIVGAHHSYTDFDLTRTVTVEGTIQDILFTNPHVVLTIKSDDAVLYKAVWGPVGQLQRHGVRRTDLKIGDTVIVSGNPARDPSVHELSKLSEVRRPGDGWTWQSRGRVKLQRTALK